MSTTHAKHLIQQQRNSSNEEKRHISLSNEEKVNALVNETGMDPVMAEEFLASNAWNLHEAIKGYEALVAHEEKMKIQCQPVQVQQIKKEKNKVTRGFSVSNMEIFQKEQQNKKKQVEVQKEDGYFEMLNPSSQTSFILPDITMYAQDIVDVIKQDLISRETLHILKRAGRLNWWSDVGACRKLFPLSTVGDGNCLLHAVSLGMWGFHDRMLTLRRSLYKTLIHPSAKNGLKRRWKYDLWKENMKTGGLTYNQEEWDEEWETVVKLASDRALKIDCKSSKPSRRISRQLSQNDSFPELEDGESLNSLEAIHVYVLSNLLCRPIIVIAEEMLKDCQGQPVVPIPFGGVYLPLERDPSICYKYPLVLAYETAHFSALVPADGDNVEYGEKVSSSVPLVDQNFFILPIKFVVDPGSSWDKVQDDSMKEEKPEMPINEKVMLLRKYLDVVKVSCNPSKNKTEKDYSVGSVLDHVHDILKGGQQANLIITAKMNLKNRPKHYKEMIDNYLQNVRDKVNDRKYRSKENVRCTKCGKEESALESRICRKCLDLISTCDGISNTKTRMIGNSMNKYPEKSKLSEGIYRMTLQDNKLFQEEELRSRPSTAQTICDKNTIYYPSSLKSKGSVNATTQARSHTLQPSQQSVPISQLQQRQLCEKQQLTKVNQNYGQTKTSTSPSTPDEEYNRIGVQCLRSGCRFYGNRQTLGFCSGCYRDYNNKTQPQY